MRKAESGRMRAPVLWVESDTGTPSDGFLEKRNASIWCGNGVVNVHKKRVAGEWKWRILGLIPAAQITTQATNEQGFQC